MTNILLSHAPLNAIMRAKRDATHAERSSFRYTECAYWLPGGVARVPCAVIVGLGEDGHHPALIVLSRKSSRMRACSS